jgi:hypothetical protein
MVLVDVMSVGAFTDNMTTLKGRCFESKVLFYMRSENFEKRLLASSCLFSRLFVCLSASNNLATPGRINMIFDIWGFFFKSVEKRQFWLRPNRITDSLSIAHQQMHQLHFIY